ncbi:hypothetical protein KFE98_10640 [bacterium SCSIO 12741]|nr:hypothetical protein KFE98_10640 [bacterium SCSIO 12741]
MKNLKPLLLLALLAVPHFTWASMNGVNFNDLFLMVIVLFLGGPVLLVDLFSIKATNTTYLASLAGVNGVAAFIILSAQVGLDEMENPVAWIATVLFVGLTWYFYTRRQRSKIKKLQQEEDV